MKKIWQVCFFLLFTNCMYFIWSINEYNWLKIPNTFSYHSVCVCVRQTLSRFNRFNFFLVVAKVKKISEKVNNKGKNQCQFVVVGKVLTTTTILLFRKFSRRKNELNWNITSPLSKYRSAMFDLLLISKEIFLKILIEMKLIILHSTRKK